MSTNENSTCPICHEDIENLNDTELVTKCNNSHFYHTSCIVNWPKKNCPVCRSTNLIPPIIIVYDIIKYLNSLPKNIEEINISNKELISLPDLSRFKNLKILNCSHNKLTTLPNLNNSL